MISRTLLPCGLRSMSCVTGCKLISLESLHEPINLSDRTPFIIGRQRLYKIKDINCSKRQVQLTPDFEKKVVIVKSLGPNLATIDSGKVTEEAKLTEGQILCLVLGRVPYKVEFVCVDKKLNNGAKSQKATSEECGKRKSAVSPVASRKKQKVGNEDSAGDVGERLRKMRENIAKVTVNDATISSAANLAPVSCQENSSPPGWRKVDTLMVYKSPGVLNSSKIAAFDMDGTIITTKSGRVFPTGPADWQILYAEIPKKLKQLHKDGYKIVFLTNQLGISRGKMSEAQFRDKAGAIVSHLGCPVHVQAAISTGYYRKPVLGTWLHLLGNENGGVDVDMENSFYCGDAAGRPEDKTRKRKKDHSCGDRLFALNAGLKFFTPEEYFLGKKPEPYRMPDFDPKASFLATKTVDSDQFISKHQEMIVNVGFPGSGKSHFTKNYLVPAGYVHVSRDELGSWQKCVGRCEEALKSGKSVVVDNTNPDVESRARYTALAKSYTVPCRCFHFPATLANARHNELFRQLTTSNHSKIPDMIMNSYKSKFVMPSVSEGFAAVVTVPFLAKFTSGDNEKIYKLYLLEK